MQPAVNLPGIQHLVAIRSMIINALQRLQSKICRKLRSSANICLPRRDDFTKDIPKEIFYIIYKHTVQRNSCKDKETCTCIGILIEDIGKAQFVFDYMNAEV